MWHIKEFWLASLSQPRGLFALLISRPLRTWRYGVQKFIKKRLKMFKKKLPAIWLARLMVAIIVAMSLLTPGAAGAAEGPGATPDPEPRGRCYTSQMGLKPGQVVELVRKSDGARLGTVSSDGSTTFETLPRSGRRAEFWLISGEIAVGVMKNMALIAPESPTPVIVLPVKGYKACFN